MLHAEVVWVPMPSRCALCAVAHVRITTNAIFVGDLFEDVNDRHCEVFVVVRVVLVIVFVVVVAVGRVRVVDVPVVFGVVVDVSNGADNRLLATKVPRTDGPHLTLLIKATVLASQLLMRFPIRSCRC